MAVEPEEFAPWSVKPDGTPFTPEEMFAGYQAARPDRERGRVAVEPEEDAYPEPSPIMTRWDPTAECSQEKPCARCASFVEPIRKFDRGLVG